MRGPRAALAGAVLLALSALPGAAPAYVQTVTIKTNAPLSWMYTNCVYLRINSNGSADIKDGSDIAAALKAMANWSAATKSCSYLKFKVLPSYAEVLPEFNKCGANENVIYWEEKHWGDSVKPGKNGYDPSALALTKVSFIEKDGHAQDGRIVDADIEFNGVNFTFSSKGEAGKTDIENTLTHELGHLLGLDHPCMSASMKARVSQIPKDHTGATVPTCNTSKVTPAMKETTMYNYAEDGETKKRSPTADDTAAICAIYPVKDDPGTCRQAVLNCEETCSVGAAEDSPPLPRSSPLRWTLLLLLGLALIARRIKH